jgi:hypothetical protein
MKKQHLSLTEHFTIAALSLAAGMGAALAADATIVPAIDSLYRLSLTSFIVNFGALFAVTGGTAGYLEQAAAQYKRNNPPPLQSWALPAQPWWDKNEGPR